MESIKKLKKSIINDQKSINLSINYRFCQFYGVIYDVEEKSRFYVDFWVDLMNSIKEINYDKLW